MTNQTKNILEKQLARLEDKFLDGALTVAQYRQERNELKETFKENK